MGEQPRRLKVAALLGWSNIEPLEYWHETWQSDGHVQSFKGTAPDGTPDREVPDYEHDAGACFAELEKLPIEATPRVVRIVTAKGKLVYEWKCGIIFIDIDRDDIECYGATPAEATCNALLAYYAAPS